MSIYEILSLVIATISAVIALLAYLNDRNNRQK